MAQTILAAHQVTWSMSAVVSCADNAAAESFFGVLKREPVNRHYYRTRAEARVDIFDYIERCHNPRQRRRLEMQQQPLTAPCAFFPIPPTIRLPLRLPCSSHVA